MIEDYAIRRVPVGSGCYAWVVVGTGLLQVNGTWLRWYTVPLPDAAQFPSREAAEVALAAKLLEEAGQ